MTAEKRKPTNRKAQQAEDPKLPLPDPAPRQPGIITSFINLVDIAESIKKQGEPKS